MVYGLLQHRQVKFPQQPIELPPWVGSFRSRRLACYSIDQKYRNYGGDIGMLGVPEGDAQRIGDHAEGQVRNYRSQFFSAAHPVTSVKQRKDAEVPSCSMPPHSTEPLQSAIYWSPQSCAHVVQGEILKLWLQLGGVKSKLGYPIDDETLTPDRSGRVSIFEHGEIWWSPGLRVVSSRIEEQQRIDRERELKTIRDMKEEEQERNLLALQRF